MQSVNNAIVLHALKYATMDPELISVFGELEFTGASTDGGGFSVSKAVICWKSASRHRRRLQGFTKSSFQIARPYWSQFWFVADLVVALDRCLLISIRSVKMLARPGGLEPPTLRFVV